MIYMDIFSDINGLLNQVMTVILVVAVLVLVGVFLFRNKKKNTSAELVDYGSFNRKESLDMIKFNDIIENSSGGALVLDNGKRFVAAISTIGFDFFSENAEEQFSVMCGMYSFVNIIDSDITFRQSFKRVDLDVTIENYKERIETLREEAVIKENEYNLIQSRSMNAKGEDLETYLKRAGVLQKEMISIQHKMNSLGGQLEYMERFSGQDVEPTREQVWIYEYYYEELTRKLGKGDIYKKAMRELNNKGNMMINALSQCGVYAERMSGSEILELMRRQCNPRSSEIYKMKDVFNSAWQSIVVETDSFDEIQKDIEEEERFRKEYEEYLNNYGMEV